MTGLTELVKRHPLIVAWILMSIAMVAILLVSTGDANLLPSQLAAMIAATIVLAGACVWIVSWE